MAQKECPSELFQWTDYNETDPNAEQDSGVEDADADADADGSSSASITAQTPIMEGLGHSVIFVSFKGNMDDEDFQHKLDNVLNGIPNMLQLGLLFICVQEYFLTVILTFLRTCIMLLEVLRHS